MDSALWPTKAARSRSTLAIVSALQSPPSGWQLTLLYHRELALTSGFPRPSLVKGILFVPPAPLHLVVQVVDVALEVHDHEELFRLWDRQQDRLRRPSGIECLIVLVLAD